MLHLQRTEHHRAGLVAVSLAGGLREDPDAAAPAGPRVVETVVADRLERLVTANVARAASRGTRTTFDLDALVARAERDVGGYHES